jgi:hypothetical protein
MRQSVCVTIRDATDPDLDELVRLSSRARDQLERYEPTFWRRHPDADTTQRSWFGVLLHDPQHVVAVDDVDGQVRGFVIARAADAPPVYDPGGPTCIVDDLVWDSVDGAHALLDRVNAWAAARGCAQLIVVTAAADDVRKELLEGRGLDAVSEWWRGAIP